MGLQLCLFVLGAIIYSLPLSYCLTLSYEHPSPNNNPTSVVFAPVKRLLLVLTLSTTLILPSSSPSFNATKLWTFHSLSGLSWFPWPDTTQTIQTSLLVFLFIPVRPSYCQFLSLYSSCLWSTYRQIPQKVKKRQPFLHSSGNDSPNLLWHSGVNCILLSIESRC